MAFPVRSLVVLGLPAHDKWQAAALFANAPCSLVACTSVLPTFLGILSPAAHAVYAQLAGGGACPGTTLPATTAAEVRRVMFPDYALSGAASVGGQINRCSYQKTRLNSTNSAVTEVVRLPCSGTT